MHDTEKRILFVSPTLAGGGAERVASILASGLADKFSYEIYYLTFFRVEGEYELSRRVHRITIADDSLRYSRIGRLGRLKKLREVFVRIKPGYIVPFLWYAGIYSALAATGLPVRIIQTVRNNPFEVPRSVAKRLVRNTVVSFAWRLMCQNDRQVSYFPNNIKRKARVVPNPVPQQCIEREVCEPSSIRILMAGRLERQKNYEFAFDAAQMMRDDGYNFKIDIFGSGSLEEDLNRSIVARGMTDYIELKGRSEAVYEEMSTASLFLLTSVREGMPNALMEAMAIGLPCVSTDCPTGPSELISDGIDGYLVPIGDAVVLASRLEALISDANLRKRFGAAAKKKISHEFNNDRIVSLFSEILDER